MPADGGRLRGERGSAMMLMPAAVLILIILGAISVDFAIVFLGERELSNIAAAAANDVAGEAVDEAAFYAGEGYLLDPARAAGVATRSAARLPRYLTLTECTVTVGQRRLDGVRYLPWTHVSVAGRVERIFVKAIPGADVAARVDAEASAVATDIAAPGQPSTVARYELRMADQTLSCLP